MSIPLSLFIAQTNTHEFIEKNRDLSRLLSSSFDEIWQDVINSDLFIHIAFIGAIIAAFALASFGYQWLEYQLGERGYLDWSKIVLPFLLVLLLAKPPGQDIFLGKVLLAFRDIGNGVSIEILNLLHKDFTVSKAAEVAAIQTTMKTITASALRDCAALSETKMRNDCFIDAQRQISQIVAQNSQKDWAAKLGNQMLRQIQDAMGQDYATHQFFSRLFEGFGTSFQALNNFAVPILFLSIGYAFYWVLELIGILTALTSPLFLGMSLYTIGHKPWFKSMSLFCGVWLARLSYSLVIGLTGLVMSKNPSSSTLLFPLIAGLFGPLLALIMGGAGGLSLFSVFTGGAAFSFSRR